MNDGNLIPFNKRTEKEQREIRSKGGKASGEARKRKKQIRELFKDVLNSPLSDLDETICEQLRLDPATIQNKGTLATVACFYMAVKRGDTNAIERLFNIAGEPMGEFNPNDLDGASDVPVVVMSPMIKDESNIDDAEIV